MKSQWVRVTKVLAAVRFQATRSIINASVVARRGYAEYFATLSIMTPKNATIDDFVAALPP